MVFELLVILLYLSFLTAFFSFFYFAASAILKNSGTLPQYDNLLGKHRNNTVTAAELDQSAEPLKKSGSDESNMMDGVKETFQSFMNMLL